MNKRGQGLSVTTIIIAAIALIVLVVLVAIFTGRLGVFTAGVQDCAGKGGECITISSCDTAIGAGTHIGKLPGTDCSKTTGNTCCIKAK